MAPTARAGTALAVLLFNAFGQGVYAETAPLALSDAWVRAMPPGRPMTAAYLRIDNRGDRAVSITGVSASQGEASLHETRVENGRSMMRELSGLSIDAGATVALEPGGMHIMLMGLAHSPAEGDVINLCLQTVADDVCLDATVRRDAPRAGEPMTNHDHHR